MSLASALSIDQVTKWRDDLLEARLSGLRSVRDQNGEEIEYKSDAQMQAAISAAEREIARLSGRSQPSTIYFQTSKGVR